MKKLIAIMAILILTLTACGKQAPDPEPETEGPSYPSYVTRTFDNRTVGIQIGEEGYYSTYADIEVTYINDDVIDVEIIQPVLLAFRASEKWPGGYYVHSVEEIEQIIEQLEALRDYVPDEDLDSIIEALKSGCLMIEAST